MGTGDELARLARVRDETVEAYEGFASLAGRTGVELHTSLEVELREGPGWPEVCSRAGGHVRRTAGDSQSRQSVCGLGVAEGTSACTLPAVCDELGSRELGVFSIRMVGRAVVWMSALAQALRRSSADKVAAGPATVAMPNSSLHFTFLPSPCIGEACQE